MKFFYAFFIVLLLTSTNTNLMAQAVGINNATPNTSSILDIVSPDKGLLIPRMGSGARTGIGAPADGLLVFDTDLDGFYFYDATATAWRALLANSTSAAIAGWSTTGNAGLTGTNFFGTTDNSAVSFRSGTGAMNFGTDAFAKTITFGNITGATALNFNTGTGGTAYTTTNGIFTVNTGTGTFNFSNDATATTLNFGTGAGIKTINIGTGAAANNITIGTLNTTSTLTLQAGSGKIVIPDLVLMDFSAINASSTTEGLILPQAADVSASSASGQLSWDTDEEILMVGTGTETKNIGIPNGMSSFTADGTFTIPVGVSKVWVKIWGGGGGGGGARDRNPDEGGGGGGGGAYCEVIIDVTGVASLTVAVGDGGAGNNTAGDDGGDSSVNDGTTTYTAGGGAGGNYDNQNTAAGGTATNGSINMTGGQGQKGDNENNSDGGQGGGSPFGGAGGNGGNGEGNGQDQGNTGTLPGGGGGGGGARDADGGDGADGFVVIYY